MTETESPELFNPLEELENVPQLAERVARRLHVLCTLAVRAFVESGLKKGEEQSLNSEIFQSWIVGLELFEELEQEELDALHIPLGDMPEELATQLMWQIEGAGILAWSLGLLELPAYDTLLDPQLVSDKSGLFDGAVAKPLLASAQLRDRAELEKLADQLYALSWRLEEYLEERTAIDFAEAGKDDDESEAFDLSWAKLKDGDLLIKGKALHELDEESLNTCCSQTYERYRAISWLLGASDLYSEIEI